MITLPDLLRPNLDLVFVGINPGTYSASKGHYYAGPGNLFWWALHESALVDRPVGPEDDVALSGMGIGFTDVVKRQSDSATELTAEEFKQGAGELLRKLHIYRPMVVCFNGLTGYAGCFGGRPLPGPQERSIDSSRVYVVPSTSRRNGHYQRAQILCWFRGLRGYLALVKEGQAKEQVCSRQPNRDIQ